MRLSLELWNHISHSNLLAVILIDAIRFLCFLPSFTHFFVYSAAKCVKFTEN